MGPSGEARRLLLSCICSSFATALLMMVFHPALRQSALIALSNQDGQSAFHRARDFTTLDIVHQADEAVAKLAKLTLVPTPPVGVHAGWNSRPYVHPEPHHHIRYGCTTLSRGVALTFDDGPDKEKTPKLLDQLNELGVRATFFVVVQNAMLYPEIVKRMVAENHTVGLHTASHQNLTKIWEDRDWKTLAYEVDEAAEALEKITGQPVKYFRPPYGAVNGGLRDYMWERGITIIMWNAGCADWYYGDADKQANAIFSGMPDAGGIVCMHDTTEHILEEARLVVEWSVTDQRFANFTRPIISLPECVGHAEKQAEEQ